MLLNSLNEDFERINVEHFCWYDNTLDLTPYFIIGAPRSGTTLLYQILISFFDIEYPTNFIAKFWGNPIVGYILQSELLVNEKKEFISSFNSHHGFTENELLEPHEFGYFWSRWFDHSKNHYSSSDTKVDKDLVKTINTLQSISKKNWVFKNLTLGLKVPLVKKLFQNAKFIYIQRDPYDTALSLYKGRIERFGNDETWWSLEPKEINEIKKLPPKEQVVAQVYYVNKQIEKDLEALKKEDYLCLNYEELTSNCDSTIKSLENFFNVQKNNKVVEVPIKKNKIKKIDKELEQYIEKYFNKEEIL